MDLSCIKVIFLTKANGRMTPLAVQACVLEALVMQGQMMVLVGGNLSQDAPMRRTNLWIYLPTWKVKHGHIHRENVGKCSYIFPTCSILGDAFPKLSWHIFTICCCPVWFIGYPPRRPWPRIHPWVIALMNEPTWQSTTWTEKCPGRENGGVGVGGWVKDGVFVCESCEPEIV